MKPAAGKKANPEARPRLSGRGDRPRRARLLLILALLAALAVAFAGWSWVAGLDRRQGLQLAAQSRFAEARPFLERALAHRPRDWEVVKVLALGQLDADEVTEAEGLLTQWSELRPGDAEPFKRRLELHLRQRKFPQALEDGRRILELEPENIQIGKQGGPLYLITGQLE